MPGVDGLPQCEYTHNAANPLDAYPAIELVFIVQQFIVEQFLIQFVEQPVIQLQQLLIEFKQFAFQLEFILAGQQRGIAEQQRGFVLTRRRRPDARVPGTWQPRLHGRRRRKPADGGGRRLRRRERQCRLD